MTASVVSTQFVSGCRARTTFKARRVASSHVRTVNSDVVSMAGAGRKKDDEEKPRGFPRSVAVKLVVAPTRPARVFLIAVASPIASNPSNPSCGMSFRQSLELVPDDCCR